MFFNVEIRNFNITLIKQTPLPKTSISSYHTAKTKNVSTQYLYLLIKQ